MSTPKELLKNIYWGFYQTYDTKQAFETELKKYHKEVSLTKLPIKLNDIIFSEPIIVIQFLVMPNDNEEEDLGYNEDKQIKIEADVPTGFTAGELLYKINNKVIDNENGYNVSDEDKHFFEGLEYLTDDDPEYPQTKVYYMLLGS